LKLIKIKLCKYRCFGDNYQTISFNDLTALIGNNSSGKTAALNALCKIFSDNSGDRILQRSDFYIDKDMAPENFEEQDLYIEAVFTFDELTDADGNKKYSVPPFFESLIVDKPDGIPYLRIRLEATWEKTNSAEGSIESKISYITCPEEAEITDSDRKTASRHDLDRIRMIYVPAMRNPSKQLKNVSGTMMFQVMNSINWSETTKTAIKSKIQDLNSEFFKEKGVNILNNAVHSQWKEYVSDERYSNAELRFNSTDIESSIKKTEIVFSPTVTGKEYDIDEMGDGLRSLFYISMVNSILDVENNIRSEIESGAKDKSFVSKPPILTIVAVEEPENHIAPHLIGKLINKLNDIATKISSQTIITSHSPAIVKRINPEDLRYFRLDQDTLCTEVHNITLPSKENLEDQYKYIKEAVKAYPELYFAKLVILGEGDSEEIVLPKFFDSYKKDIDSSGISIVPLGGRHVNHFWRLLNDLKIPFITLLDLDRERDGGGWGRIKYVLEQLIKNGYSRDELLKPETGISDDDLDNVSNWDVSKLDEMQGWIDFLEKYNVLFSSPLDLDFLMLEYYGNKYKNIISDSEGPFVPQKGKIKELEREITPCKEYEDRVKDGVQCTLKKCGGDGATFTGEQRKLMVWYNYFFLNRGKPSTHILALSKIEPSDLLSNIPPVIDKILKISEKILKIPSED
jgi:putative ATP-dependent endonuclease of OLD family